MVDLTQPRGSLVGLLLTRPLLSLRAAATATAATSSHRIPHTIQYTTDTS